jgi:AcrR family transcriptional regulator
MSNPRAEKDVATANTKQNAQPAADSRLLTLVEAAENVFLAKGYHAATMDEVARAAGMSKKTIYTLIRSKADLFATLLVHHQALLQFPELPPDAPPHEVLVAHLLALAQFLLSPAQIDILRLIMAEYTHSPDFGRVFLRNRLIKAQAKLENCLSELMHKHGADAAEAKDYAAMLFGMALGEFYLSTLIAFRAPPRKQILEARIRRAVEIFCAGCCGPVC